MEIALFGLCGVLLLGLVVLLVLFRRGSRELQAMKDHLQLLTQDIDGQLEVLDRIERHTRAQVERGGGPTGGFVP